MGATSFCVAATGRNYLRRARPSNSSTGLAWVPSQPPHLPRNGTGDVALVATVGGVQTQTGVAMSLQ